MKNSNKGTTTKIVKKRKTIFVFDGEFIRDDRGMVSAI